MSVRSNTLALETYNNNRDNQGTVLPIPGRQPIWMLLVLMNYSVWWIFEFWRSVYESRPWLGSPMARTSGCCVSCFKFVIRHTSTWYMVNINTCKGIFNSNPNTTISNLNDVFSTKRLKVILLQGISLPLAELFARSQISHELIRLWVQIDKTLIDEA